ncbi:MAG TPA: hypothetical protein VNO30_35885 [Kofleriaceae bacterium]|nr:hypothetical protein [Kofleriaceae bacterium]
MKLAALLCVGLLAGYAGLRPAPADACSCMRRSVRAAIDKTAPTNTRVMLWFSDGASRTAFTLREAGGTRAIAVERKDVTAASYKIAELVPKQPLRGKTAYEVVDGAGDKVLEFTTTAGGDTKAPEWKGIQEASYVKQPGACCVCNTGTPYVIVDTGAVSDDHGHEGIVFAVWSAAAGGKIDYTKPPTTYVRPWETEIALGHPSICGRNNFDLPDGKKLRIGVRPVDLAGNIGVASEIEIDLSRKPNEIPDI